MNRSNCLIVARILQSGYGGSVLYHQSFSGWWPHWYWRDDLGSVGQMGKCYSYLPTKEFRVKYDDLTKGKIPPLLFYGSLYEFILEDYLEGDFNEESTDFTYLLEPMWLRFYRKHGKEKR